MKYHIQVFISVLLFALSFVWSKQALDYISPVMLVTGRVLIAATLLTLFAVATKKMQSLTKRDALIFFALAAAQPVGYFLFEKIGLLTVTPTLACLIIGLYPVVAPIFAAIFNKERISSNTWIGLLTGFSGVAIVTLSAGTDALGGQMTGILLVFCAVICTSIYAVVVQRLSKRFNGISIVSWVNIFSLPYLIPILLIFDFENIATLSFSWAWLYPVLALGVLCSSIAFVLNVNGIRELGVTRTAIYVNLMPGLTAVASYFMIGEPISALKILGISVAVAGLFIANIRGRSNSAQ